MEVTIGILATALVFAVGYNLYQQRRLSRIRKKEIKKTEERRSAFISIISHQLRTPLSVIKGYLEGVLTGDQGEISSGQKEYLQEALDINIDAIHLVNDYLEVVQLDPEKIEIHPTEVNLEELVRTEMIKLKSLALASNCELIFHKPDPAVPSVKADVIKLKQVIENILTNAIKYTRGKGKAEITLLEKDGVVTFSSKDNGVGVPDDQQDEIFTKFFRGRNVINKDTTGSGLGLYLTKMIINAHGGDIFLESQEGRGTTVTFTLPTY